MNYYEELGLSKTATVEQIRQAYRSLARMLHPDQHHDDTLRRLAECQMKRLNAIIAVLSEPNRRREYDVRLERDRETAGRMAASVVVTSVPCIVHAEWLRLRGVVIRNWAWVLIAVVGLASGVWCLTADKTPKPEPAMRPGPPPGPELTAGQESTGEKEPAARKRKGSEARRRELRPRADRLSELQRELEIARSERDTAVGEIARLRARTGAVSSVTIPAEGQQFQSRLPTAPAPQPTPSDPAAVSRQASSPPRSRFAGTWFFARARRASSSENLYPPDYIELVILEEASGLRGSYRARYRIADRAISPEVAFQFEGQPPAQNSALFHWTAGGAEGELQLKLLSENSIQASWWATDLGKRMGLASGTAVLIRRQDP